MNFIAELNKPSLRLGKNTLPVNLNLLNSLVFLIPSLTVTPSSTVEKISKNVGISLTVDVKSVISFVFVVIFEVLVLTVDVKLVILDLLVVILVVLE